MSRDHASLPESPLMSPCARVRITPAGLEIDGEAQPLMSGAVHYWRIDPARWPTVLDAIAGLGFRIIETYVPWSVHERRPGGFDFGESSPQRAIGTFLELARERGLLALVRPGPHINSELTDFGFPSRLLAEPRVQARTAHGTVAWFPGFPRPFPIPSYASRRLLEETRIWFQAVVPHLARWIYPAGPVVAFQVDNELSNFFRTSIYDLDYSDDALTDYREFLLERYGGLQGLNAAYGSRLSSSGQIEPPRKYVPADLLLRHLDWCEFQSHALLLAWRRIKALLREHLPADVPLFTNLPPNTLDFPFDLSATEQLVDQVGLDLYYTRRELGRVQQTARALCAQTRLPSCPEFGAGCFLTWVPTGPEDNQQATLSAAMYGVRSFNFYMLVDRERWYGSPIRVTGQRWEPHATFYERLMQVWTSRRLDARPRSTAMVLLRVRRYDHLAAITSLINPITPIGLRGAGVRLERFTRDDAEGRLANLHGDQLEAWEEALEALGLDFDLGDSQQARSLLERYRVLIVPTGAEFEGRTSEYLLERARAGAWVVMGPVLPVWELGTGKRLPTLVSGPPDQEGEGWQRWAVGAGHLVLATQPAAAALTLRELAGLNPGGLEVLEGSATQVHVTRLPPWGDLPELVWVMNEGAARARVRLAGVAAALELMREQRIEAASHQRLRNEGEDGESEVAVIQSNALPSLTFEIPPQTVFLLEVR